MIATEPIIEVEAMSIGSNPSVHCKGFKLLAKSVGRVAVVAHDLHYKQFRKLIKNFFAANYFLVPVDYFLFCIILQKLGERNAKRKS